MENVMTDTLDTNRTLEFEPQPGEYSPLLPTTTEVHMAVKAVEQKTGEPIGALRACLIDLAMSGGFRREPGGPISLTD